MYVVLYPYVPGTVLHLSPDVTVRVRAVASVRTVLKYCNIIIPPVDVGDQTAQVCCWSIGIVLPAILAAYFFPQQPILQQSNRAETTPFAAATRKRRLHACLALRPRPHLVAAAPPSTSVTNCWPPWNHCRIGSAIPWPPSRPP